MGRTPCCDKVGLKRGPWTPEEDRILISFIEKYGHSNWRALPKQAGLLRCGKSCRLRWTNYLRPDIKRGNFSKEEEDTIIQLHQIMGNRWSAIASKLSGRTDNEIKNVWHTHLKKRVDKQNQTPNISHVSKLLKKTCDHDVTNISATIPGVSSQQSGCSDDFSSLTDVSSATNNVPNKPVSHGNNNGQKNDNNATNTELMENDHDMNKLPIIDDTFWSPTQFCYDDICMGFGFEEDEKMMDASSQEFPSFYVENNASVIEEDTLDFWLDVFVKAGGPAPDLPNF